MLRAVAGGGAGEFANISQNKKKLQRAVWCAVAVRCLQFGTDRRIAAQQVNKN